MSIEIAENLITPEMVVDIYKFMAAFELKRKLSFQDENFAEGQADGFLQCLALLIGEEEDEEKREQAYNDGKTIGHVTDQIVQSVIQKAQLTPSDEETDDLEKWEKIRDLSDETVVEFVKRHYSLCFESIKRS